MDMFVKNGIRFLYKSKKYKDELVKIKIVKFFSLEEIAKNIFLDKHEKYHAYFRIPRHLTWEEFDNITNKVKYNWVESTFDAAMGAFYYDGELHDVVRVYSNKIGPEYLDELQKMYLDKMK
jgi:dsRNA-specific ribonuclease